MLRPFFLILILVTSYSFLISPVNAADVNITASIDYCLNILTTPEKRIPPTHNNSVEQEIWIRPENSAVPIYTTTITSDNEGLAIVCPVPASLIITQYYDILIKGLSHLRRLYPHQSFRGSGSGLTFDLRSPLLLAGDSHPTADNYVNSLDISYEILNLYTTDLRADLNRDTVVNSLEFPTLISHLYAYGDN